MRTVLLACLTLAAFAQSPGPSPFVVGGGSGGSSGTAKFSAQWNGIAQSTVGGLALSFTSTDGITLATRTGTLFDRGFARFALGAPSTSKANFVVSLPSTLPSSVNLTLVVAAQAGTSNVFTGTARTICIANAGDPIPAAWVNGTQAISGMTSSGSAGNTVAATVNSLTLTGCSGGNVLVIQIARTDSVATGMDLYLATLVEP